MPNAVRVILEISIYSSAMILAVLGIHKIFSDKLNTKLIHALWLLVFVRLLLPITFESPVHLDKVLFANDISQSSINDETDMPPSTEVAFEPNNAEAPQPQAQQETTPVKESVQAPVIKLDYWALVLTIWVMAAVLILLANIYQIVVHHYKLNRSGVGNVIYQTKLDDAKRVLNIKKDVRIVESVYADIPFVYSYFKPVILMPPGFSEIIGDKKLSCIILHELCHVKRRDVLAGYIWMVARTVHWFNPLVHVAYINYLNSVEECCDAMVVKYLDNQGVYEYTQSLLDVIRFSKDGYRLPLAASFGNNHTTIRKRVMKMIKPQKKSKAVLLITVLVVSLMTLACFTTACQPKEAAAANPQPDQNIQQENLAETELNGTPVQMDDISDEETETISEEQVRELIDSLNLATVNSIELQTREEYFGDKIAGYICNDTQGPCIHYHFLESDKSLVSYEDETVDLSMPMQLSGDELHTIALDYVKQIWGDDNIQITSSESGELGPDGDFFYFELTGILGENNRAFDVTLNGNGELWGVTSYPQDVDFEKGVSIEQAKQIVIELLQQEAHVTDSSKLTLISVEITSDCYSPMYILKYEYRADTPNKIEFNYDSEVKVVAATGQTMGAGVDPITTDIDVIPIEQAGQMAREHIIEEEGLEDASKLIITLSSANSWDGVIMYHFEFDYGTDYKYTLMMTAEGEFWDIAGGPVE